ncbi:5'-methylthioadenosine/adenosylhomocysteine nucleosidase [Pararobbsia silviterrae]|uniref:adenosylhomocysteine nucleosidase n=1 Tax=Pararobbsia silviterrae TaxID=1792498 RepID=A0A494XUQ8_9BURK|nr:5'-methylthioadenosine/adenosylhomocysteine nucleosidase [Pararobbsia silviterrae]RKP51809.1 5'-methylthioadenosine/adenosylhomocysteine nucleosidase [Pararobbsia silviterrae]
MRSPVSDSGSNRPIGIVAAMPGEITALINAMRTSRAVESHTVGRREFYSGELFGRRCVVVLAGVGKVAAAITATTLIRTFDIGSLVFVGVAGGLAHGVSVGDIVVAQTLLQHDLDASPLFPRYEVPLLGVSRFETHPDLASALMRAAEQHLEQVGIGRVYRGLIVSGDQFISDAEDVRALRDALPDALAVEMEGAAIAQACNAYDLPFAVVRTISDSADGDAGRDFPRFLEERASAYSLGVIERFLEGAPVLLDEPAPRA